MSLLSKLGNIKEMKNQAQAMQAILAQEQVVSANKAVKIIMNGNQEILDLTINDEYLDKKSELEQEIKNAFADVIKQVQRLMASKLGGMI